MLERSNPKDHPVSLVQWVNRDLLQANTWNPNHVAPPELELLQVSIEEDGWTQPIVVQEISPDSELGQDLGLSETRYEVVDGFHRWKVSGEERIGRLTDYLVPVVVVTLDPAHARLSTIRHNRARGTHRVGTMADIVIALANDLGLTEAAIMERLGMEREEVTRFLQRGKMTQRHADPEGEFREAWRAKPVKVKVSE